jgi:hypothetical protein
MPKYYIFAIQVYFWAYLTLSLTLKDFKPYGRCRLYAISLNIWNIGNNIFLFLYIFEPSCSPTFTVGDNYKVKLFTY